MVPGVANAVQPQGSPADEVAVQKVVDGFIASLNAADVNSFMTFFAPDATLFFPLSSLPLRLEDRQQIATAFGAFFEAVRRRHPDPPYMNMIPVGTKVQLLGSVAVVTFHLKGEGVVSRRTLVLEKRSGAWLIVHLHASSLALQKE
jgi:ketosteroid isomerase-like protein